MAVSGEYLHKKSSRSHWASSFVCVFLPLSNALVVSLRRAHDLLWLKEPLYVSRHAKMKHFYMVSVNLEYISASKWNVSKGHPKIVSPFSRRIKPRSSRTIKIKRTFGIRKCAEYFAAIAFTVMSPHQPRRGVSKRQTLEHEMRLHGITRFCQIDAKIPQDIGNSLSTTPLEVLKSRL